MNTLFSLVGRAGFEPATNGLKGRYALSAQGRFPLCAKRMGRTDGLFSPALCQILPTSDGNASAPSVRGGGRMEVTLKGQPMEWQPIETAPKDGTNVLIWTGHDVVISRWRVHYMEGVPDPRRAPEWEQRDMYAGFGGYQGPLCPSHWMPLPAPPVRRERVPQATIALLSSVPAITPGKDVR